MTEYTGKILRTDEETARVFAEARQLVNNSNPDGMNWNTFENGVMRTIGWLYDPAATAPFYKEGVQ